MRDSTSCSVATQVEVLKDIRTTLASTEAKCLSLGRENVELASRVLQLAEESERNKAVSPSDPDAIKDLHRLEGEVKASRQRWHLMKGTASAIVAGSGVNWAQNPELRSMVMDPE